MLVSDGLLGEEDGPRVLDLYAGSGQQINELGTPGR